jgi:uncharacterized membrane protein (TIGR02234 family)
MAEPRRTFAPVVLLGLASGALAAVAGTRQWAGVTGGASDAAVPVAEAAYADAGQMPLAGALSLLVLAGWGVVLVTRGRVRRAVAVVGAVAAVGLLVTTVVGWWGTQDDMRETFASVGLTADVRTGMTGWYWAALLGAAGSLVATLLAVRYVAAWPAMGSRYDAPGTPRERVVDPADAGDGELWRAIDEGQDPTA